MRRAWILAALLVAGCASNQMQSAPPQIQRITAEELEKLTPKPAPILTYDELARLSKTGVPPDEIISRIRSSGSRYALTPSQAIDLARQGVDPKVLDFMHAAREQSLHDVCADELNKRDRQHRDELDKLQQEMQLYSYPYCDPFWGPYPPYWRYPYIPRR